MGRLDNKKAVITGGTSGIGEATAIMFAKEGAEVVLTGRNAEKGEAIAKKITDAGGKAWFFQADLTEKENIAKLYDFAVEKMGCVNVLMNNAGVLVHKPFLEHNDDDLMKIFSTNFRPYIWNMQQYIPGMIENGGGSIINVASISSFWPEVNAYFYGSMKAAVSNLTMNVAKEFARKGVRVNGILPGPVTTGLTPKEILESKEAQQGMIDTVCMLGRLGVPDDIAYGAVYLASDESSWMTAHYLVIDGGVHISN